MSYAQIAQEMKENEAKHNWDKLPPSLEKEWRRAYKAYDVQVEWAMPNRMARGTTCMSICRLL